MPFGIVAENISVRRPPASRPDEFEILAKAEIEPFRRPRRGRRRATAEMSMPPRSIWSRRRPGVRRRYARLSQPGAVRRGSMPPTQVTMRAPALA